MSLENERYLGLLYRALNPVYAREPLSGRGAAIHGGRFNRKGVETLYTSLTPETAIREANQVGDLQPTTLVAYRADIGPIFDSRDVGAMAARRMTQEVLADAGWRLRMIKGETVPTQTFADGLVLDGFAGLLVRSFATGARDDQLNLVHWRWNSGEDNRLELIDDQGRLSRI
ncbi:MAG: RES family NAD+ phosphorylase [Pseudomonadota bacterium]